MFIRQQMELARVSQHTESSICDHCAAVTIHETWCITCNAVVRYAFGAASSEGHLTLGDELNLHALGVEWNRKPYEGNFRREVTRERGSNASTQ